MIFQVLSNIHKFYILNDGLFILVATPNALKEFESVINPNTAIHREFMKYNLFQFVLIIDCRLYQINLFKLTIEDLSENTNYTNILKSWKKNLYGHQLKILYYNDPPMSYLKDNKIIGNDGYFLDILCNKLNATCLITNKDNKEYEKMSTIKYDIQFNLQSLYRPKYESDNVKMLYPRELDNICVLIAIVKPNYTYDFFSSKLIKFIYFICVGFTCVLRYLFLKFKLRSITVFDMILDFIRIILLQPIVRKLNFGIDKFLIVVLGLSTMIIYECYLKNFTSQLIIPSYICNINTVSQLNSSNFKIYVTPNTFDLLNNTYFNDQYFLQKFTSSNYMPENRLHSGKIPEIEGFVMYKSVAKLFLKAIKTQKSETLFHLMNECLVYSPSSYPVENNMAFTEEMNKNIMLIREAGLEQYWNILFEKQEYEDHFLNATKSENFSTFNHYEHKMLYKDMAVAFKLLFLLYFVSIIVFMVEFLIGKNQVKIQKIIKKLRFSKI